jgi:hypothetical protein
MGFPAEKLRSVEDPGGGAESAVGGGEIGLRWLGGWGTYSYTCDGRRTPP